MNTMNNYYFRRIRRRRCNQNENAYSKVLSGLHKLMIVISIYLVFGLLFQHVYANTGNNSEQDPYQSQHGSVWLLSDDGVYIEALQTQTDVDYDINGPIARAKVKQRFINSSGLWAEGLFVFPLPEKAAVDHFRMVIGERIIEGQIKERAAAKKTYEAARSAGKKASLIEQQRPNVFTTSLANIAPGEEITIEFEFQQVLDYKDDSYRLRFPMVVGTRYHSGHHSIQSLKEQTPEKTSVYTETDQRKSTNNPVRIHVLLDAGVSLYDLNSSYHRINITQTSETRYSISTIGENITADRDFELVWKPQLNKSPQLSAFNEKFDDESSSYTMLTLFPPDLSHLQKKVQARDVIFVIDVSGSMAGTSIEQARSSLVTALGGLTSIDRFNIIWFNDETGSLFPETVSASSHYKDYAKRFIENLSAGGGTEMLPAMKLALAKQESFSRFRQVVFITDGNVDNEDELFGVIDEQLGHSRLFTIGIGSAPNAYFMRKAAQKGRGTFTYIGDINEVHKKTIALFKKIETPALINIQLDLENTDDAYQVFPAIIPDLYAGETAMILIKGKESPENIAIKGDYGNIEWQSSAQLKPVSQGGIKVAWAREKIASLMSKHHESTDESQRESIQQDVTDTALQHHLVSRFTSLVAVDVTPVNADGMLYRERLKNNLPHGWKSSASANGLMLAQASTNSRLNLLLAMITFLAAALIVRWKNTDH